MAARSFLSAYILVGILNVIAELSDNVDAVLLTKPLLVPLLIGWLVATARRSWSRSFTLIGLGLVFAWAGDLLLLGEGDTLFALGLVAFLVMQILYIAAFRSVPGPGLVRAWPLAAVPYALAWVVLAALTWSGAGGLLVPVLIYGAVLMVMAAAALDLVLRLPRPDAWLVAAGGALFAVSDALIALTAFGPLTSSTLTQGAVMATYIAAQGLIVMPFTRGCQALAASRSR